jgi:hypothetical protein
VPSLLIIAPSARLLKRLLVRSAEDLLRIITTVWPESGPGTCAAGGSPEKRQNFTVGSDNRLCTSGSELPLAVKTFVVSAFFNLSTGARQVARASCPGGSLGSVGEKGQARQLRAISTWRSQIAPAG